MITGKRSITKSKVEFRLSERYGYTQLQKSCRLFRGSKGPPTQKEEKDKFAFASNDRLFSNYRLNIEAIVIEMFNELFSNGSTMILSRLHCFEVSKLLIFQVFSLPRPKKQSGKKSNFSIKNGLNNGLAKAGFLLT